ncbi:MAG: GMC family oxidoreductase [Deltaproteobacteria bacterium]|nr:GMC family oxidoreductase [Deltaproteobacteria bacterium]
MIRRAADYRDGEQLDCDVVVIGTGAGGAAAGATLAEAGIDVVFLEEGGWHPTSSMNPYLAESMPRLWREAGTTVIYGRSTFLYAEGRCVGGSTVINGGMTYRPPESVLGAWERTVSAELGAQGLDALFARAERDLGAAPQADYSIGGDNRLMAEGAARLGWRHQKNHRNQDHCVGANNCILGCPTGAKQSTLVSYMPRAMQAGARALTELRAERLEIAAGRCVGVHGRAIDPATMRPGARVSVRARHAVVVACGAVQTPLLLLRHRVGRPSRQLGRNFVTHPNAKILAVYPFSVGGWRGVSQWGQVREFHDDGIVFAENMAPPGAVAAAVPSLGRAAWRAMQDYDRMVLTGVLVEDSAAGRVYRGPFGMAVPTYSIQPADLERFLRGLRALGQLHFEMGAERLYLPIAGMHEITSPDALAALQPGRVRIPDIELFTPHLMGTARMGGDRRHDVVGLDGQAFDLPGLYVADASLFPTPIAVNPQITIAALALKVADRLAESVLARRAGRTVA